ncbi:MAG: translocation/assembly module TamB domain-containing protein [Chthoniobacter sp.]|nr:translocation/assembly module TamB domain-containing protein [Chthoniobacter sp.]
MKAKPRRGWFRRALRWLLPVALVLAIFHRPLFHHGARFILVRVAAHAHLQADLRLSGNIFTNLTIDGIHARPVGDFPNPVRRLDIARVRLDYSLPRLVKHGLGEFLSSYEISQMELEIEALPSRSTGEKQEKQSIAQTLNTLLGQPALYSDRVKIENLNLTVRAGKNVTEIRGFHLLLDPRLPGEIRAARVQIPGVPVWENLAAATNYAARNLAIRDLQLAPELVFEKINFDASKRAKKKGSLQLKVRAFGGTAALALAGSQLDKKGEHLAKSYDTTLTVTAADVSVDRALAYFHAPRLPVQPGTLRRFALRFTGEPEKPRSWEGRINAQLDDTRLTQLPIDRTELAIAFHDGHADLTSAQITAGKNRVAFTAQATLPASVSDFPRSSVDGELKLDAPDLATLTALLPAPFAGRLSGGGPITLRGGAATADLTLDAAQLAGPQLALRDGHARITATKRIDTPRLAPFEALDGDVSLDLTELRVNSFALDTAKLRAASHNERVTLDELDLRRAANAVTAQGTWRIPRDFKDAARAPGDVKFALKVPRLADFGIAANGRVLAGRLDGHGALQLADQVLTGAVQIDGGDFTLGDFKAPSLAIRISAAERAVTVEQFAIKLSDRDQLTARGTVSQQAPFSYDGQAIVNIRNVATLQPLLAVFGVKQTLAGALRIEWGGKGETVKKDAPLAQSGTLAIAVEKARIDKTDLREFKLAGFYGPGFAQSTELHVASGPTDFTGVLELKDDRLRLRDINLTQAKLTVLTGFIFLPIALDHPQQFIPLDGRIAANLNATKLDLEKLLASFGQTSPVSGNFTANLVTGGTLLEPVGHLKVTARGVQAKAVAALEPADLDLDLHYSKTPVRELTLAAVLRQPQIQPLTVKGRAPFDLDATLKDGRLDPKMPLDVTVLLPPSALAFVPKLAPQIRRLDGTAGLDVRVTGTVEKPVFSGAAAIELKGARLTDENIPGLGVLHAKLGFANDTLNIGAFDGELGGGTFRLGGTIKLPKLTEPVFDLRLQSKEVLLKRDDAITVRGDADIKIAGPLKAGMLTGTLFLTQSRFFKEIDILPIALPGKKAKPAPRAVQNRHATVSFPQPPLRDWKFDLAIKTRADDPFLVRGNLANGAAAVDLKFAGTGLAPYLEGSVRIEKFKASLPFSTLSISRGFVYFKKDEPFQPSLELQADSQLRDYLVHAYIYGRASDPQIQLNSEPPLPYGDIVSLLATGTTIGELGGSADVLASRAAMLAVQQLYRKAFKRGAAPPADEKKEDAGKFMDRFQVELGALDNRSGGQEVNTRFRMTDNLYFLGDIGVGGRFTGSVKYLIRFR